uniref:Uncharacterized protein n=1 Tax=Arundo donax TaxID=35708 RepID=A0A0A8Z8D0_ARUDO
MENQLIRVAITDKYSLHILIRYGIPNAYYLVSASLL